VLSSHDLPAVQRVIEKYGLERLESGKIEVDIGGSANLRLQSVSSGIRLSTYTQAYDLMYREPLFDVLNKNLSNLSAMKVACASFMSQVQSLDELKRLNANVGVDTPDTRRIVNDSVSFAAVRFVYGFLQILLSAAVMTSSITGVAYHATVAAFDPTSFLRLVIYCRFECGEGRLRLRLPLKLDLRIYEWISTWSFIAAVAYCFMLRFGVATIYEMLFVAVLSCFTHLLYVNEYEHVYGIALNHSVFELLILCVQFMMDLLLLYTGMVKGSGDVIICVFGLMSCILAVLNSFVYIKPGSTILDYEVLLRTNFNMDFMIRSLNDVKMTKPSTNVLKALDMIVNKALLSVPLSSALQECANVIVALLDMKAWTKRDEIHVMGMVHSALISETKTRFLMSDFNKIRKATESPNYLFYQICPNNIVDKVDNFHYFNLLVVCVLCALCSFDIRFVLVMFFGCIVLNILITLIGLPAFPFCPRRDLIGHVERIVAKEGLKVCLMDPNSHGNNKNVMMHDILPSLAIGMLVWVTIGTLFAFGTSWHSAVPSIDMVSLLPFTILAPLFNIRLPVPGDVVDKNKSNLDEVYKMLPVLKDLEENAQLNSKDTSVLMKLVMKHFNNGKTNKRNMELDNLVAFADGVINWALDASSHWEAFYKSAGPCSRNLEYDQLDPLLVQNADFGPSREMPIPDGSWVNKLPSYPHRPKGQQSDRFVRNPYVENLTKFMPNVKKSFDDHCMTVPDEDNVWAGWVKRRGIPDVSNIEQLRIEDVRAGFIALMRKTSLRSIDKKFHRVRLQDYPFLEHNPKSSVGYTIRTKYHEKQGFLFRSIEGISEIGLLFKDLVAGVGCYFKADPFGKFEVKKKKEPKKAFGFEPPEHGNFTRSIIPQEGRLRTLAATIWIPCHEEWMANCSVLEHAIGQFFYGIRALAYRMASMLKGGHNIVIRSDCDNWDGRLIAFIMLLSAAVELSGFEPRDERDMIITDRIFMVTICDYVFTVEVFTSGMRVVTIGKVPSGFGNTSSGNSISRNFVDKMGTAEQYSRMILKNKVHFIKFNKEMDEATLKRFGAELHKTLLSGSLPTDPDLRVEVEKLFKSLYFTVLACETVESMTGGDDDMTSIPKGLWEPDPNSKKNPMLNMRDYFKTYAKLGVVARDYAVAERLEDLEFYSQRVRRLPLPVDGNLCVKQYVLYRDPSDSVGRLSFIKRPVRFEETREKRSDGTYDVSYVLDPTDQSFVAGVAQSMLITNFFSKSTRLVCRYVLKHCPVVKSFDRPDAPMNIIYPQGYKWSKMYQLDNAPTRILSDKEIFEIVMGYPLPNNFVGEIPCIDDTAFLEVDPATGFENYSQVLNTVMFTKPPDTGAKEWVSEYALSTREVIAKTLGKYTVVDQSKLSQLPVQAYANDIIGCAENNRIFILLGGTGSGK